MADDPPRLFDLPAAKPNATDAAGHRARLRERLFADPDGLHDYELVEYLLGVAIPRIDTKPIAKELLRTFGDLPALLIAEPAAIARVKGMGEVSASAIKVVQAVAVRMMRVQVAARPVLSNWQALIDYLHADMAPHIIERVRVLHLNSRNMLIRDDLVSEGSIDQAPVYVREVLRRAMDLGSASLILVHNHPSGDPSPSKGDIDLTRALIDAAKKLGIAVHDHLIVGSRGHVSLKSLGLI
jgi:DNA repair protein RadC